MTQNSQNISENTSNVTVKLFLKRNDGYASSAYNLNSDANTAKLTVGGSVKVNKNLSIDTRNSATVTLASWTGDVSHTSDGTLTLSVSGTFSMTGTSLSGGTVSGSYKCTDIPRASKMTFSKTSVNPGGDITASITSASSTFSHKIKFSIGSYSTTKSVAAGTVSYTFSVPQSWANAVTKAKSGSVSATLYTYRNSTLIGTKEYSFTLSVPNTSAYKPSFSVTLSDTSGNVPSGFNVYVKGKSILKVTLTDIQYKYGATLSSVSITVDGITKKKNPSSFELAKSGNLSVGVTLYDSRGYSSSYTSTVTVFDYSPPSISFNSLFRCLADGTPSSSGTYLCAVFSKKVSSVDNKNQSEATLFYKMSGSESYVSLNITDSPVVFGNGGISLVDSYDVKLTLRDSITTAGVECERRITSTDVPFNIRRGGKGAAFGCYSETDGELTVNYNLNVRGRLNYEDITSEFTLDTTYVSSMSGTIIKYPSLKIAIFNLRFNFSSQVGANTNFSVGSLLNEKPSYGNPMCVYHSDRYAGITACVASNGSLLIKTDGVLEEGSKLYVSGVLLYK